MVISYTITCDIHIDTSCHHTSHCVLIGFLVQLLEALLESKGSTVAAESEPSVSGESNVVQSDCDTQGDSASQRGFRKPTVGMFLLLHVLSCLSNLPKDIPLQPLNFKLWRMPMPGELRRRPKSTSSLSKIECQSTNGTLKLATRSNWRQRQTFSRPRS